MSYKPNYSKEQIDKLKTYVENFKKKFLRIRQEKLAASSITENNGHDRYIYFNNLLFDGELPDVTIRTLKTKDSTLAEWIEEKNLIKIYIYKNESDYAIDTVLVHEMCHVWQDRIWKGKNPTAHGNAFQYAKNRTQKRSNNYYNGGAFINIWKRDGLWNSEPSEIDKALLGTGLKLKNLAAWEFKYGDEIVKFNGSKFVGKGTMSGIYARRLNNTDAVKILKKIYKEIEEGNSIRPSVSCKLNQPQ